MNASMSAALLLVLIAGGWLLGRRRPRPFLRSTDTSAVAALNRVQIERQRPSLPGPVAPPPPELGASPAQGGRIALAEATANVDVPPPALPLQAGERQRCLRQLQAWMTSGSRDQRLQALALARQSSRRDVLPLLRRGLRDPDPAVIAVAAAAMGRFRGRSAAPAPPTADARPWQGRSQPGSTAMPEPRSVLRTR